MNSVEHVYRAMTTKTLLDLQVAFHDDLAHGADPDFVSDRLTIIARELADRARREPLRPVAASEPEAGR